MNAEIWRSEIALYGFMILNVLAVLTGLVWAWRRGHLCDLDDSMLEGLEIPPRTAASPKENAHG
jgi:hypothetical protein